MPHPKNVAILAYPGAQILDITGPAAVFDAANRIVGQPVYETSVVSSKGGLVRTSSGVTIATTPARRVSAKSVHTVLVVGADEEPLRAAIADATLRRWLLRVAPACVRFGSVCTGAFVLAAHGLLTGKRVTTHWRACADLAKYFPTLTVDSDALYVKDGRVWTSAGVTTGIDMALALVEHDVDAAVAGTVAQNLVLYARRPGFQSQFSPLLQAQRSADAPFQELIEWMQRHLGERLDVERLAQRARQSPRTFHRHFSAATGQSPAHFVEALRLDRARALMARPLSLKEVADKSGFGDPVRLSRAFERRFGIKPSQVARSV